MDLRIRPVADSDRPWIQEKARREWAGEHLVVIGRTIYRLSRSLFLLLTLLCADIPVHAQQTPAWTWKGFEIIGNHTIPRQDIQSLAPIRPGDTYTQDPALWQKYCIDLKARFSFAFTECSAVRYSNFEAYFIIEIVEPDSQYRLRFRPAPQGDITLASPQILTLYERLYKRLWELFEQGTPSPENAASGYLDYSDPEMHAIVQQLITLVPAYRENILEVLANDRNTEKRQKAANLLNWTRVRLSETLVRANHLLDDPDSNVRNNISRFTLAFLDELRSEQDRLQVIDQLLIQLDRPSHGDRNKAIYNLLYLAQKYPMDVAYIRTKGASLVRYISEASILSNVREPALELLRLLQEKAR